MGLRVTTWNVNGIRNPFGYKPWSNNRTFDAMFEILEADIVIMQELKIQRKDLRDDMVNVPGWDCFFSLPKHKKGYSGVGIYTRQSVCQPIRAEEGLLGVLCPPGSDIPYRELPEDESIGGYPSYGALLELDVDPHVLDSEGRVVVLEFPAFVLFGVYAPANTRGDEAGSNFRHAFWNALDTRIRKLEAMGKRVILTGDLNNAVCEIDIAGSEEDMRKEGVTHQEFVSTPNRRILNQMLVGGEVFGPRDEGREEPVLWDACRHFHPKREGMFTHWDTKKNTRPGNFGSRIDYVLCSPSMESWTVEANIQEGLQGSDHCPVYAVFDDVVVIEGENIHLRDIMNPSDIFVHGVRQEGMSMKAKLALSGRMMPEFNVGQRQSIKDMFKRQPSGTQKILAPSPTKPASTLPLLPAADASAISFAQPSTQNSTASLSSTQSPSKSNAAKRKPSETNGSKSKKSKQNGTAPSPSHKGQGSLKSFFQPKAVSSLAAKPVEVSPSVVETAPALNQLTREEQEPARTKEELNELAGLEDVENDATEPTEATHELATQLPDQEDAVDHTQAAEKRINTGAQWGQLMRKPKIPLCEDHDEPCKEFQTKKKGVNCGRIFYICARPLGPSGEKEKNTQWRCRSFIWASDWQGGAGG